MSTPADDEPEQDSISEFQQDTVDEIDEQMKAHKEAAARITGARRALAGHSTFHRKSGTSRTTEGAVQINGDHYLQMRRMLGLPDPDGGEWGLRMVQYHVGQIALVKAAENPAFAVSMVPARLREWLRHPIWDRPATDADLKAIIHAARLDMEGEAE